MSICTIPLSVYDSTRYNYTFSVDFNPKHTEIFFRITQNLLYTSTLPNTISILSKLEPRILKSVCFNARNLPFSTEVKKTETAHLFEHILLEYLCQEGVKYGRKRVKFSGLTEWNWKREAQGTFHISITGTKIPKSNFATALAKTVLLFDTVLAQPAFSKKISSKQIDLDYLFVSRMRE
jgi:hypothetical protein